MKYRKKPIVIDAEQFTEELALACLVDKQPGPFGLNVSGCFHPEHRKLHVAYIIIRTLEGPMRANPGDWIVKGTKGELYPVRDDIFQATYEQAESR